MMSVFVRWTSGGQDHSGWTVGYMLNSRGQPCAVVLEDTRFLLIALTSLTVVKEPE